MFNPGVEPMSPAVQEHGPEALRAVAAGDGPALDRALSALDFMDLEALQQAAAFLADACRASSR